MPFFFFFLNRSLVTGSFCSAMINFSLAITRSIWAFSELGRYKGTRRGAGVAEGSRER